MKRELTCIVCPLGCNIEVELEDGKVVSVKGNTCPRGEAYAKTECIDPRRTITTTVRCQGGSILPVKTKTPVPKDKVFDAMRMINNAAPHLPISVGDVIIKDVFGSEVIATKNITLPKE